MRFPSVPKTYLRDFIRGYFDGDGCVFLEEAAGKRQERIIKRLSIILTSESSQFLEEFKAILKKMGGIEGRIYQGNRAKQLRYFTKESIIIFPFMYKNVSSPDLYMRRKYVIFERYFSRRPTQANLAVRKILKNIRPRSQVVRQFSAKELYAGAIPAVASR